MAEPIMTEREGLPGAPPLFVIAFSRDGKRFESLLESGLPAPDWFGSAVQVRVQAPSGERTDGTLAKIKPEDAYTICLAMVGPKRAWAPDVLDPAARNMVVGLELWTDDPAAASVSGGPVLTLQRPTARGDRPVFGGDNDLSCYAVVRRRDNTAVYVSHAGRFYLDILPLGDGAEPVPRALLDTSLAGAFWGFTEHQNPAAAKLAAQRLLSVIFNKPAPPPPSWIAAASHAVLTYRDLLPDYGDKVLSLLRGPEAPAPDAVLLRALIGIGQLGLGKGDEEVVMRDLRAAITALSGERARYGETVRLLDARFSILRELALNKFSDGKLRDELAAVSVWLGKSYAGGQIAAYLGEAPIKGDGWHDALAQKKNSADLGPVLS